MHDADGHRDVLTATSGIQETYYGMPVIRAPNWHWLVVNYLFLGGLAGGGYCVATIAEWFGTDRRLTRAAHYLSMAALIPSPVLLMLDLGRPDRALHMLRIVKLRSPLSLGSWAMTILGAFSTVTVGLQLLSDLLHRDVLPGPRRAVGLLGLPFGLFFSGYTGLLLGITNVPVWAKNSLLLGPTFMASAFSTTFASLSLILTLGGKEEPDTSRKLARAEAVCLLTEINLLTTGILRLGRLGRPLTTGPWGRLFWPVTYVSGLLVPLGLQLAGPARGKETPRNQRIVTSLLVLIGGYALRTAMIFAGHESANRPEDYFEYTKKRDA
ncbi:MAG: polysulfide reductase NrfD [Chloroflexota bacterium]